MASKYSGAIGEGRALKLAVKVPNFVAVKVAAASFGLIPKISNKELTGDSETAVV